MTYKQAQDILWQANLPAFSLAVASAELRQESDGTYSVIIDPLHEEPQIHSDAMKAASALWYFLTDASAKDTRYFTLAEDGVPIECDQDTWEKDTPNRDRVAATIRCSSEIDAYITFDGLAWAIVDMDEEVRLWRVIFHSPKNKYFGKNLFTSLDRARLFVNRFIELGCPEPDSLHWGVLVTEFQTQ